MALLVAEGFEHIHGSADVARRFTDASSGFGGSFAFVQGSFLGSLCLRTEHGESYLMRQAVTPANATAIIALDLRVNGAATAWDHIALLNSSNVAQLSLRTTQVGGMLQVLVVRGSTVLFTSPDLAMDVYHFIELQAFISTTIGTWVLRINEMTVGSGSGNTANSGSGGYAKLLLNPKATTGGSDYIEIDNVVLMDGDDSDGLGHMLGRLGIECLVPVSGVLNQWTANTGTNVDAVDDGDHSVADDDTGYVFHTNIKQREVYVMSDIKSLGYSMLNIRQSADISNPGSLENFYFFRFHDGAASSSAPVSVAGSTSTYVRFLIDRTPNSAEYVHDDTHGFSNSNDLAAIPHP